MRHLSPASTAALFRFAEDGDCTKLPDTGELRVLNRRLQDRHAVGIVRQGRTLWVIMDLTREDALPHLRELLRAWPLPAVLHMPFVTAPADGAVELVVG